MHNTTMATEQIIHPISAPPNAPKYYYPGVYYYTPEPYQTTHIPKHHHHFVPTPVKHAVHDFVHPLGDGFQIPAPHCDIRETKSAYYLDVELPGLKDRKDVKLRWTGTRSLFVDAKIEREKIQEEGEAVAIESQTTPSGGQVTPPEESPSASSSSESDKQNKKKSSNKSKNEKKAVHFLKKERKTGELARAFNFPVDVEQDNTVAKLAYGVLSVVVPKKVKHPEEEGHRDVEIEHAGH